MLLGNDACAWHADFRVFISVALVQEMLGQHISMLVLLLPPRDVLHVAQTGTETLKQTCFQMFSLTETLYVCLSCKTMGNNNARLCNLCDVRMCRPGNVLPSPDRPRLVTTTFENDWTHLHNRWMVPQLLWKPHILTLLMHFWCLIQDIRDTQMLHLSMHFVTAVTITLNNNAESLNPGPRPHTTQVVEFAEYSDSSSNP